MAEEDFYTMWGQWATQTCQKLKTIRKLEEENKKLKKEMQELKEKTDPDYAAFLIAEFKIEMGKLELKKNAYKRDSQRRKECLDAALNFNGFCVEKVFSKECLYTLWLEQKAHERNLELARDRERLADGWLLEAACIEDFLRKRGVKKPL